MKVEHSWLFEKKMSGVLEKQLAIFKFYFGLVYDLLSCFYLLADMIYMLNAMSEVIK
jgi:hypothetical protein